MHLVFWKYIPSLHDSAFIRALALRPEIAVTLVVSQSNLNVRVDSGWNAADFGPTKIIVAPSLSEIHSLIRRDDPQTVHIFCGINSEKTTRQAFKIAIKKKAFLGLMSERSFGYPKLKKFLNRIRDTVQAQLISRHLRFFFGIGILAVEWYDHVGFPAPLLYPFGYFMEPLNPLDSEASFVPSQSVQIAYIGQGSHLKGLDMLLKALSQVEDRNWELHLIGNIGDFYHKLCRELNILSQVEFHGILGNGVARNMLSNIDLLVLPSRYDGWGSVVNEALMQGVPVICSDQCGAQDLIRDSWRGDVFRAGSVSALSIRLDSWIARGKLPSSTRARIINWSECVSGERGAQYFLEVIEHIKKHRSERPQAPWLIPTIKQ